MSDGMETYQPLSSTRSAYAARFGKAMMFCLFAAALPGLAFAQSGRTVAEPRFEFGVGFTLNDPADVNQTPKCKELGLPCTSPKTFSDGGLMVLAAVHATRYFGVAVEASRYNNMWDTTGVTTARTNHVRAVLAGPLLTTGTREIHFGKDTTAYRVFSHVLAGPEASDVLPTRIAWQPGAGFDAKTGISHAWIRVGYDYRLTRGSPRNLSGQRILCALLLTE